MTDTPAALPPDPPLDRTISPIAGRLGAGRAGKALVFAALLLGCGVFAAATWSADRPKAARTPVTPARQVVAFEPARAAPTLAAPGDGAPSLLAPSAEGAGVPALDPGGAPTAAARSGAATAPASPILAYTRGTPTGPAGSPLRALTAAAAEAPTELDQLRRGSAIGRARAHTLGDRGFLILAGASLPCVLQTALDSSTAGYATCVIPQDVYSDNGAVVLLDKGTRVLGEYRAGLRQGQRRLFVIWTRAVTPNGVAITLGSPASDALGRAGFDGAIDTHFWDRFGGALLLSLVDDGAYALAGRNERSGVARLPSDAAGVAVHGSQDIPPTLRKPQGSEVAILVAQDLDFSGVYGLASR